MVKMVQGEADGHGPLIPEDFAEAVQRIAEICGEFSLGGCGITQYRATFPAWNGKDGDELAPRVISQVEPEKVEGIFTAIYLRLKQTPEYQPLETAIRERDHAHLDRHLETERADAAEALVSATSAYWYAQASGDGHMPSLQHTLDAAKARLDKAKEAVARRKGG